MRTIFGQVVFPVADMLVALLPDVLVVLDRVRQLLSLQNARVNANDDHFLIVRTVKNANAAAFRESLLMPPQIVMVEFLGRRSLKCGHLTALRIDAAHHMFDRAVLSGGVHSLKNDEK